MIPKVGWIDHSRHRDRAEEAGNSRIPSFRNRSMHATHAHRGRSHRHVHTSPHHAITRSVFCPFESSEARYIRLILYETGSSTPARTVSPPYRDPATPTNSPFQNGSRPLDVEIRIGLNAKQRHLRLTEIGRSQVIDQLPARRQRTDFLMVALVIDSDHTSLQFFLARLWSPSDPEISLRNRNSTQSNADVPEWPPRMARRTGRIAQLFVAYSIL